MSSKANYLITLQKRYNYISIPVCEAILKDKRSSPLMIEFAEDFIERRTIRWIITPQSCDLKDFDNNKLVSILKEDDIYIVTSYGVLSPKKVGFETFEEAKQEVDKMFIHFGYIIKNIIKSY